VSGLDWWWYWWCCCSCGWCLFMLKLLLLMLIMFTLFEGEWVPYICSSVAWLAVKCWKRFTVSDVGVAGLRGTAWGPA